jgi:hypothetical protein
MDLLCMFGLHSIFNGIYFSKTQEKTKIFNFIICYFSSSLFILYWFNSAKFIRLFVTAQTTPSSHSRKNMIYSIFKKLKVFPLAVKQNRGSIQGWRTN